MAAADHAKDIRVLPPRRHAPAPPERERERERGERAGDERAERERQTRRAGAPPAAEPS